MQAFPGDHRESTSAEFLEALPLLLVNLRRADENEGYLAARQREPTQRASARDADESMVRFGDDDMHAHGESVGRFGRPLDALAHLIVPLDVLYVFLREIGQPRSLHPATFFVPALPTLTIRGQGSLCVHHRELLERTCLDLVDDCESVAT